MRRVDLRKAKPRFKALFGELKIDLSRPKSGIVEGRSFPSSHTVNNFCVAIVLSYFYRKIGWLWFFVAALVGYSRVYVGAHWPSDIAASMVLGTGIALLAIPVLELIWRAFASRALPEFFARHPTLRGEAAA